MDEEQAAPAQRLLGKFPAQQRARQSSAGGVRGADLELRRDLGGEAAALDPVAAEPIAGVVLREECLVKVVRRDLVQVEQLLPQRAFLARGGPGAFLVLDHDAEALEIGRAHV